MNIQELKSTVISEVEKHKDELIALSLKIHDNPELSFKEFNAAEWLCDYLQQHGFSVKRGICDLPTSFKASYGSGSPNIAFLAEYDALPEVGHACGHNVIATSSLGAAIAVKSILKEQEHGTITVIGTPGEETGGGKALMVKQDGFKGIDAAMLVHPGRRNAATVKALACIGIDVEFFGKSAHAAASPDEGINALEAMILAFNAINSLRQHIKDHSRIHGIVTHGGQAANVVPDYSSASFLVRAEEDEYLDNLCSKVVHCLKGAAEASGARLEYTWSDVRYAPMQNNLVLAELFHKNCEALGIIMEPIGATGRFGSTDMGNVSKVVPSIHPSISIAPKETMSHSHEFAVAAASISGHQGLIDAAKAMAMTAVDLFTEIVLLKRAKEEFSTS